MVVEFKWGQKTWGDRVKATRDSGVLSALGGRGWRLQRHLEAFD